MRLYVKQIALLLPLVYLFAIYGCGSEEVSPDVPSARWNIPEDQIRFGGVPKDGIPSLSNPKTISAFEANYLGDDDLVVGIVVNGEARAYPHAILDWHEVVNESFGGALPLTVSYCPLTGTAVVFEGRSAGQDLTFGVSGLLFNNNLIMFDRQTDSHWPQMRMQCDQGELINTKLTVYPAIETAWGTWKKLFPNTVILSTDTGFDRHGYQPGTAYPGYSNPNSSPLFDVAFLDDRLPPKQRVHGVLVGERPDGYISRVYVIDTSQKAQIINDELGGRPLLVINDGKRNFAVSYVREANGQTLTFDVDGGTNTFPYTLRDNETGSTWNLLGEAVDGPLQGTQLQRPIAYNAYWFAWGVFYRDADIYQN